MHLGGPASGAFFRYHKQCDSTIKAADPWSVHPHDKLRENAALREDWRQYNAAMKSKSEAIDKATDRGWDLNQMKNRQSLYASQQPWSGSLLHF